MQSTMKSEQARMKSSPTASDEIKSASLNLAKQDFTQHKLDFIHECGFIPTQADLVEKDSRLYPILSLFLVRMRGLAPQPLVAITPGWQTQSPLRLSSAKVKD